MPIGLFRMPFKPPSRVQKLTRWNFLAFLLQSAQLQCRLFQDQLQAQPLPSFQRQHNHHIFLSLPTFFHLISMPPLRTSFKPGLYLLATISLHLIRYSNITILGFYMETLTYILSQFQYQHQDQEPHPVLILCHLQ